MRIAQVTRMLPRSDYGGGVSGQVDLLAGGLAARGHDVTVFAVNAPPGAPAYDVRLVRVPARVPKAMPYFFQWSVGRLRFQDFDVVHAHGDDMLLRTARPVIRTFHGSSIGEARHSARFRRRAYHWSMVPGERIAEWRASACVTVSANTRRYLWRDAVVIPNSYDNARFVPGDVKSERPSVLFVGDLDTRKRGRLLLDVFARIVRPVFPDAELWIVSADRPVAPGVRAFGRVPAAELADLYRRAWLFCMPSSYEGFGVPYLEAMACGTPVVATPNGGAEEVLAGGRYGRLVSEGDLGPAIVQLLGSSESREALRRLGLERAREYEICQIATRYETLYRSVIG